MYTNSIVIFYTSFWIFMQWLIKTILHYLFCYLLNMDPHFDLIFYCLKPRNFSTNLFFQHFKFVRFAPMHTIYPFYTNTSPQYIVHQMNWHLPTGHVREAHGKADVHIFRVLHAHVHLAADVRAGCWILSKISSGKASFLIVFPYIFVSIA